MLPPLHRLSYATIEKQGGENTLQ